jgi:hypothetical protein
MQNPNLNAIQVLWLSACGASVLWFLYWIIYDLIIWNKVLVQVNPLNYLGLTLALSFAVFSGLGVRKTEAVCYLGSTASFLWFSYWILFDVLVWDKKLVQVNTINYVGALLSLFVFFIPRILSMISTKRVTTEPAYKKISMQTKKRKIAK